MPPKEPKKQLPNEGRGPMPGEPRFSGLMADAERLVEHVRENPLLYIASAVFVLLCVGAGLFYGVTTEAREREMTTVYAEALTVEDPTLRVARLENVVQHRSRWTAEALYMLGESAVAANESATALRAFQRIRDEHNDSPYSPRAAEGIAFLFEQGERYADALAGYQEILDTWPDSFTGVRQHYNIGRMKEKLDDLPGAIDAYSEQRAVFPDSAVAARAEQALERLRARHPDYFTDEVLEAADLTGPEESAADRAPVVDALTPPVPLPPIEPTITPLETGETSLTVEIPPLQEAPAEDAPAEDAPVEDAPAEDAPVEDAPVEEAPVEEAPADEAPVEEAPAEDAPVEDAPVEEAPVEEAPADEAPVDEAPVEEAPVEEAPAEDAPVDSVSESGTDDEE